MELIPHDELKGGQTFNFAPMIDFLFLMLALFATLAVSRAALYDSEVQLVELKPEANATSHRSRETSQVNLSISASGSVKWLTDFNEYPMESVKSVQEELARQHAIGVIPHDKAKTDILLHIDRNAPWEPIAKLIFAIREVGFNAHPVYEPFEAK
jgi:biopolymer transport protein ExbD